MKNTVRSISVLLLLCMLLPAFCACKTSKKDKEAEPLPNVVLFDPEDPGNAFGIVYPAAKEETLKAQIETVKFAFADKFGGGIEIASMPDDVPCDKAVVLDIDPDSVGENAYKIEMKDGKLSITGKDNASLAAAVRRFLADFVWNAEGAVEIAPDCKYTCEKLADPIVKNEDGSYNVQLSALQAASESDTGYAFIGYFAEAFAARASLYLAETMSSASAAAKDGAPVLLLGKGKAEELRFRDFRLGVSDNTLKIDAISAFGFEAAFNYLYETVKAGELKVPADGLLVRYDYGDTQLGKILDNYENPFAEDSEPVAVAHRGCFANISKYPENSIKSYNFCINNRVDVIETDLQLTSDGYWVICHDDSLNRTTSGEIKITSKRINRATLEEIKTLYLRKGSGNGTPATTEKMPTLEEIIEIGKDKVLYNLDKVTFADVKTVYDIFEAYDAVGSILYKTQGYASPDENAQWFAELIASGRKLPAYAPMFYDDSQTIIKNMIAYQGMISMVETSSDIVNRADLQAILDTAKATNVRPMILTIDENPKIDCKEKWDSIIDKGVTGIMTNFAVDFIEAYRKK